MEASQSQYTEDQLNALAHLDAGDVDAAKAIAPEFTEQIIAEGNLGSSLTELASLTQEQLDARYDAVAKGSPEAELIEAELARRDTSMLPQDITRVYVEGKRSAIQVEEPFDEVTNQLESGASLLRLKARTKGAHLEVAIPASRIVSVTGAWSL